MHGLLVQHTLPDSFAAEPFTQGEPLATQVVRLWHNRAFRACPPLHPVHHPSANRSTTERFGFHRGTARGK